MTLKLYTSMVKGLKLKFLKLNVFADNFYVCRISLQNFLALRVFFVRDPPPYPFPISSS